jgi:hypothetical protein
MPKVVEAPGHQHAPKYKGINVTQKDYPVHPAAELFPPMSEEEFAGLRRDIQRNGQIEKIVLWRGMLIDGRHRLRACRELSVEPVTTVLNDDADPVAYVIGRNLHRRHLTTTQRSDLAAKLATLKPGANQYSPEVLHKCNTSLSEAAVLLNVSKRSVSAASYVQDHGCEELKGGLSSGEIPVALAEKLARKIRDKEKQAEIAKGGSKAIRQALAKCDETAKETILDSPEECSRKIKNLIQQCIDRAIRLVDDLHRIRPNQHQRMSIIRALQEVKLW